MRLLSVAEQRYEAVMAVDGEGRTIGEVAHQWRVDRRTIHRWLARYEIGGMEGLGDRSHRPTSCPHQMAAEVEAMVLELRRWKPYWGPRCGGRLPARGRQQCPSHVGVNVQLMPDT
jgi:transposase